ncbi:imidazole glycerol phosphate synthase subunit HisH [Rubrimonas cliftonensis]|uniref:Imidazole glycerol phosphate synthase subunit HisH n=1 Tax=Rubrimonas cliftonensis TaxID=89524 RepID=A0A1H3YYP0_9RHOB|nr:imidazole glycerol phosphate synthase subunit HisH [Rubrimonas cliftonensis]SEA16192.1 glutamine amidotransferase [Rubrimonas cliftonensis]
MSTVILDYGSGNLRSALKAFQRMAEETGRGGPVSLTADPEAMMRADRVVLPGVGAFADCARGVEAASLRAALEEKVIARGAPFLGICVGMQLLATVGREHGDWPGFGWIPGEVARLEPTQGDGPRLKVPQIGWNALSVADHPLFDGIAEGDHAYFVHSYHLRAENPAHVLATADHGGRFAAAVGRDNIAGVQFHPEKSQRTGLRLIANFLSWTP